jgi:two-component system nitrate/nitrite response regulator NarL
VIKVIIAEDHPIVLHGLASLLKAEPDFQVLAACSNGDAAFEAILKHVPDIALLDIKMPGRSGVEVMSAVVEQGLSTKVVFITATASDHDVLTAIEQRSHGLVLKEEAVDVLVACLRAVHCGRRWISRDVIEAAMQRVNLRLTERSSLQRLSTRERMITTLVADGLSNKEVARRLDITEGTVKLHLHNIYEKTGVRNRTSLAVLALHIESHDEPLWDQHVRT